VQIRKVKEAAGLDVLSLDQDLDPIHDRERRAKKGHEEWS